MSPGGAQVFRLAPMSGTIRALTAFSLAVPVLLAGGGLVLSGLAGALLLGVAGLLAAGGAAVWIWARPTRFEVTPAELVLVWPGRRRRVPRPDIGAVRPLDRGQFRQAFGWAVRIGVGGLWGGFGFLWTSRRGLVELYVSRLDRPVLVERRVARALILTPERPDEFVRALGSRP